MKVEVYSSFVRDSKKLSAAIKEEISDAITLMQNAKTFSDIPQVKAMQGGKKAKNAYRMRISDYRICFFFRNEIKLGYCLEKTFITYSLNAIRKLK